MVPFAKSGNVFSLNKHFGGFIFHFFYNQNFTCIKKAS